MKLKFVTQSDFFAAYDLISSEEKKAAEEYLAADFDFGDFEMLCAYSSGCILFRYYSEDAGYHFEAPLPLTEKADMAKAFEAISEYCLLEAIPEVVIGIEPEYRDLMLRGAENFEENEDDDGTLAVCIYTECMTCCDLPEMMIDDVYLGEFAMNYAEDYERLVKNENLNCHFGYNIIDDIPNGDGKDFINFVREEFERGESMTFAATTLEDGKNRFVGEGCLYAFNGRGEASLSFRVLPELHRHGVGTKILRGLLEIADSLGLRRVSAEVKRENSASLALLSKVKAPHTKNEEKYIFIFELGKEKNTFFE